MVPAYLVDENNHVLYVNVHECRKKKFKQQQLHHILL